MIKKKSILTDDLNCYSVNINGISFEKLEKFADCTDCNITNFLDSKHSKFFVPGVYLLAMFRHVVDELHKKNKNFPIKKLESFSGSNGSTIENRLFIDEDIVYKFKFLTKYKNTDMFLVEILKTNGDLVLSGHFYFK